MTATLNAADRTAPRRTRDPRTTRRAMGLLVLVIALAAFTVASIAFGAKTLPLSQIWDGLIQPNSDSYAVVHQLRLPRTLLGLLAGAALGVAGALMQTLTRNPLADPGILGINAGAAAAVVSAISFAGITSFTGFVWFALAGAAAVGALVYLVGGGRGATPARLALAGAALNAALYSYVNAVQLIDTASLDTLRFWTVGSLASAEFSTIVKVLPFLAGGLALTALLARPLDALALGDDTASALGARPWATRAGVLIAITLLCGTATAACGPLMFIGLMVPHLVRPLTGPSTGWLLPYCAVGAPVLLLAADTAGRLLARPAELQVGIVTAVIGGPFFLYFVRRHKAVRS